MGDFRSEMLKNMTVLSFLKEAKDQGFIILSVEKMDEDDDFYTVHFDSDTSISLQDGIEEKHKELLKFLKKEIIAGIEAEKDICLYLKDDDYNSAFIY